MVSALHHEGQRLYDLARQGITVERQARTIHIDELELTAFCARNAPRRHAGNHLLHGNVYSLPGRRYWRSPRAWAA